MDYCHPCRRHLNGALACAGCGTPAAALGPYAAPAYTGHEPESPGEVLPAPTGSGGSRRRAREAPVPEVGKRGTRGRQRARGRRGQRRRGRGMLIALLGVLLTVGVLTLSGLAIGPDGDDGAADYVRDSAVHSTEPAPVPSSSVVPDAPPPVESPTAVPSAGSRGTVAGSAKPGRSAGPGTSRPAATRAGPSPSAPTPSDGGDPGDGDPGDPPDSADPSRPSGPSGSPPRSEPPQEPEPTPSPTKTCVRFLWWCT